MYRPRRYFRRGGFKANYHEDFRYERSRYACKDCRIACSSSQQLEQHQKGLRHRMHRGRFFESSRRGNEHHRGTFDERSREADENFFHLDHMVVLDQTEDELPKDNAASPASCDSEENAASPSSQMVILDETNDDNDHPASPASCDSSASESAPSSPATMKTSDETPRKKPRLSEHSSTHKELEPVHGSSEKSTRKQHHEERLKTRREDSKKMFNVTPIENNQDVFQYMKLFAIANDSDVAFAKKVKDILSRAVKKYEQKKLEEIFCTEAENSSPEDLVESDCPSDHEQTHSSVPQATNQSECKNISSAPGSPPNSSPKQCISNPTSSANGQPDLPIINQSDHPDTSSIASRSPTNKCEDKDTTSKPSAKDCTNDNLCSTSDLMESDVCITACSDDEDV